MAKLDYKTALMKARVALVLKHPFFATLLMYLPEYFDENVKTMGTDGRKLVIAPSFVEKVANEENGNKKLMFILCHEVMHVVLYHLARRQLREPMRWNVSTDIAVNIMLNESCTDDKDNIIMPDDALFDLNYKDMTAEVIYSKLPENYKPKSKGGGSGEGKGKGKDKGDGSGGGDDLGDKGNHEIWNEAGPMSAKEIADWKEHLSHAAITAKQQGKMPGGMDRLVDSVLYPKVDWRTALRNFIQPKAHDYGWNPPDRRFSDYAIPDIQGEAISDIVIAIDTSGSIGQEELKEFLSEVYGIVTAYDGFEGYICSCDAAVHSWQELTEDSFDAIRVKGGGGTSFVPVFDEIERKNLTPAAVIYLTDGYGDFPKRSPDYPVMWVMTTDVKAPFGATVEITLDDTRRHQ